eukprot:SAG25_NODE_94_length_15935_cov_41.063463_21_plen_113_part_00
MHHTAAAADRVGGGWATPPTREPAVRRARKSANFFLDLPVVFPRPTDPVACVWHLCIVLIHVHVLARPTPTPSYGFFIRISSGAEITAGKQQQRGGNQQEISMHGDEKIAFT